MANQEMWILKKRDPKNPLEERAVARGNFELLHKRYDINFLYPVIGCVKYKDRLLSNMTRLVYKNIDFVIASLKKKYSDSEKEQMKTRMSQVYWHMIRNESSNYKYAESDYTIQGNKYGRLFSTSSVQGLSRRIRNTIVDKENCVDIDMVNAHPSLLIQLAQTLDVAMPTLNQYVLHRGTYIDELVRKYSLTRDDAKKVTISVLNGARRSGMYPDMVWIKEIECEIQVISDALKKTAAGIEIVRDISRDAKWNEKGSLVNHCLCKMENEILSSCVRYLESRNIEIYTLCFDGLIASRTDSSILEELSWHVFSELGLRVEFDFKSFDEDLGSEVIEALLKKACYPCEVPAQPLVTGMKRRNLSSGMFASEMILNGAIYTWIESTLGITSPSLTFDGEDFVLVAERSERVKCLCWEEGCVYSGNATFKINNAGHKGVQAFPISSSKCKRGIDITSELGVSLDIFTDYNTELFKCKRLELQRTYKRENVQVIKHDKCHESINFEDIKSKIIIQTGYAGYGKTSNVFKYINKKCITTKDLLTVVISNLAVQNTNFCTSDILNNVKTMVMPVIHCTGNSIKSQYDKLKTYEHVLVKKRSLGGEYINYPSTGHAHTYVVNSKSLQDCLHLPESIDILFIDEHFQVFQSVSSPSEMRRDPLYGVVVKLIKKAKKIFICDIVFSQKYIDLINSIRQDDHITHYLICDSNMKMKKVVLTDDTKLLSSLIESGRAVFVSSDYRRFIVWLYLKYVEKYGEDKCLMIVGKDHDVSTEDRVRYVNKQLSEAKEKPYVFCSPAVTSSVSIMGERTIIGVRFFDFLHKIDTLNAMLRAREGKEVYLFNFAREFVRRQPGLNPNLPADAALIVEMIQSVSDGGRFDDLMAVIICPDLIDEFVFDWYYKFGNYRKLLREDVGFDMNFSSNKNIQVWLSDRYGLKLVDRRNFYSIISKINEDLSKKGQDRIVVEEDRDGRVRFHLFKCKVRNFKTDREYIAHLFEEPATCSRVYEFENLNGVFYSVEEYKKKFRQMEEEMSKFKTKLVKGENIDDEYDEDDSDEDDIEKITRREMMIEANIEETYEFFEDFRETIKPIFSDFIRIIKQNLPVILATNNYTQEHIESNADVNVLNIQVGDMMLRFQRELATLREMAVDDRVCVHEYVRQILVVYNISCDQVSLKKSILITRDDGLDKKGNRIIKIFHCVTDTRKHPYNTLQNDEYDHDFLVEFMNINNIKSSSTKLYNMINYQFKSQDTHIKGSRICKKSIKKVSKSNIRVEVFDKNN